MDARRIQETGKGTFLLSLPKQWVLRHKLQKKDIVYLHERENGSLVIFPSEINKRRQLKAIVKYSPRNIEHVEWGVTASYLLGFDLIRVEADVRFTADHRKRIRDAIQQLVGLEIIEESSKVIQAQCLIDPSLLAPEKLLKRKNLITINMLRDAVSSLFEGDLKLAEIVVKRDDEVNRLYFLLVRLLRSAVKDPDLADKLKIKPIDCLDYRVVATLIEANGDNASEIAKEVIKSGELRVENRIKGLLTVICDRLREMQVESLDAVLKREVGLLSDVNRFYSEVKGKIAELNRGVVELGGKDASLYLAVSSLLDKIASNCLDIGNLMIPRELLLKSKGP